MNIAVLSLGVSYLAAILISSLTHVFERKVKDRATIMEESYVTLDTQLKAMLPAHIHQQLLLQQRKKLQQQATTQSQDIVSE